MTTQLQTVLDALSDERYVTRYSQIEEAIAIVKELLQDAREALAPTIKQSLAVHASAEEYLQYRYGAYRGHFAWRELEEAYSQGRYDEAMLQGPNPWPDDEPEIQCGIFCEAAQREIAV